MHKEWRFSMRLSLLLFLLYRLLWLASKTNKGFKKFIQKASVRVMIKTEDGRHARLFIFNRGTVSSITGPDHNYDVAMVWKDSSTAFNVLLKKDIKEIFNAAASGKLKIKGMSVYAVWFDNATSYIV